MQMYDMVSDVLSEKPHPQFDTKILSQKVQLICASIYSTVLVKLGQS